MHFTQTRIATIDVYITFFVIAMYYFMYSYCTMSFYDTPLYKTFVPLGLCGICMGFGILVAMQSITNIGVISGWLPTTGVTAPFVSYGGSSMMSLLMCVGLVLNVCRRTMRSQQRHAVRGGGLPSYSEVGAHVNGWH